jgi:hypothetical protein
MVYLESREEPPQKRNTVTSSQQKPTELQSGIQGHKVTHFVKTTNRLRIAAVVDLIRSPRTTRYFGHSILDSANTNDLHNIIIIQHHRRTSSTTRFFDSIHTSSQNRGGHQYMYSSVFRQVREPIGSCVH